MTLLFFSLLNLILVGVFAVFAVAEGITLSCMIPNTLVAMFYLYLWLK